MRIKKVIKKIVALGTGLSMMGATMFGAFAAADLNQFPSPFVKDATFNAKVVVGEAAKTEDVIGAIDIFGRLQFENKKAVSTGTGTVSLVGDSHKLSQSTNKLEINELLTSISKNIVGGDLQVLANGEFTNDFGTHSYTQQIEVPDQARVVFDRVDDDFVNAKGFEDVPTPYLKFPSGSSAYIYKVSFSPHLKSDHNTGSSGYLEDIRNKKITLLGKKYTILKAAHTATNNIKLTLMAGSVQELLDEGATKTYTLADKEYEITATSITTSEAKFIINDEVTDSLTEGDTFKLADGVEVGVVDIIENEAGEAAGGDKVEFTLGANKVVIDDTDTNNKKMDGTVTVGSDELDYVKADIITSSDAGIAAGADVKISDIKISYNMSDNLFVPKGYSLSEVADTLESDKNNVFLNGFDIKFEGLEVGTTEEIKLKPSGSNNYRLEWTNKNGQKYNQDIVAATSANAVVLGERSGDAVRDLHVTENGNGGISKKDYFIVSRNGFSHIMQFTSSTASTSENKTKIKDVGGDSYDITLSSDVSEVGNSTGNLNIDGNTFKVKMSANGETIWVDMNGDSDYDDTIASGALVAGGTTTDCTGTSSTSYGLVTENEACISFVNQTGGAVVRLTTTKTENTRYNTTTMNVTWDGTGARLDLNTALETGSSTWLFGGTSGLQLEDEKEYWYMDAFGTTGRWERPDSAADTFTWTYPKDQAVAAVFYTAGATEAGAAAVSGAAEIVRINVGAAVLDTDPSVAGKEKTQNVIAVGGPAVNRAAAVLLGLPFPTWAEQSGIPENAAIIKLVENGGNVGLVVAGWGAADTQRAARVVANYDKYTNFKGSEVQVTGTSLTDITVSAVSAVSAE